MGKGRRIQDFRNLNLDNSLEKKNNYTTSITDKEFVIEVQEKSSENNNDKKEKVYEKTISSKAKKKVKKQTKKKSPKTYIEEEHKRQKKEKQKKTSKIIATFLLVFICIGVIAGCLTTSTFDVTYVKVDDGENVMSNEIHRYFSQVKGKNTFLINLEELEQNIQNHPYIYKAEVSRILPSGLEVNYKEKVPYAIIKYIESYVLIDKYGSILEIKKENENKNLPIIYGIEAENFVPGSRLEHIASLKFENAVYLLETAKHVSFNYTISEINYTDSEEIRLSIEEQNIQIIYGAVKREILNDKMAYLNEILKKLGNKKGTLDISSTNYSEKVIFTEILK